MILETIWRLLENKSLMCGWLNRDWVGAPPVHDHSVLFASRIPCSFPLEIEESDVSNIMCTRGHSSSFPAKSCYKFSNQHITFLCLPGSFFFCLLRVSRSFLDSPMEQMLPQGFSVTKITPSL
jgi:hypothetical protein